MKYQYSILRAGNPLRDEWTNIGVFIYANGLLTSHGIHRERAEKRGDLPADFSGKGYASMAASIEKLDALIGSTAHCMSSVQFRQPYPTRRVDLDVLMDRLVL